MPLHENPELKRESFESLLMAELVGLGTTMRAAMDANPGFVPCSHAFGVLLEGLDAAAVPAATETLREQADKIHARSEHIAEHRGVPRGAVTCPYAGPGREPIADAVSSARWPRAPLRTPVARTRRPAWPSLAHLLALATLTQMLPRLRSRPPRPFAWPISSTRLAASIGYHVRQRQVSPRPVVSSRGKD